VRRYTGDRFSAAKGYDLRKPMSKARARTIARYFELAVELTSRPHLVVPPPKGGKREAFAYTGQLHHLRFTKAIVHTPEPGDRYSFKLDRTRPRGSRFVVENRRTRERSWHIPAAVFLDENPGLFDPDEDPDPDFFQGVIEDYGEQAEVYMIEAGENHMWGDAGSPERVGGKLAELFKQYGAGNFDPFDRNSHFIGNWFRGVQAYSAGAALSYMSERRVLAASREVKWGLRPREHFRALRSGDIGRFYQGTLVDIWPRELFERMSAEKLISTPEYGVIKVEDED
jgi:hypothetical protein